MGLHPVCPQHRRAGADLRSGRVHARLRRAARCAGLHRPGRRPRAAPAPADRAELSAGARARRALPRRPARPACAPPGCCARLHAFDLLRFGITADCLPVLDVPVEGASDVIGTRAYGKDPDTVAALGRAAAEGLMSGGVLPVMKHIPGHGRAFSDTHFELPTRRHAARGAARARFRAVQGAEPSADGMTAHVVYSADRSGPARRRHRRR